MDPKCNDINPKKMEEEGDFTHTHTHTHTPQHDIKTERREGAGLENWNDAAKAKECQQLLEAERQGAHP